MQHLSYGDAETEKNQTLLYTHTHSLSLSLYGVQDRDPHGLAASCFRILVVVVVIGAVLVKQSVQIHFHGRLRGNGDKPEMMQ